MGGVGMKVALTGSEGYIGSRMANVLMEAGHDVTGFDNGMHRVATLYRTLDRRPAVTTIDTRDITEEHLRGFDAVVHLAEISNDPVGQLNPEITANINHRATVRLAENAKRAGVHRFVHMSSCSVYGASGEIDSDETSPTDPLTAYAKAKLAVEQDVAPMSSDSFVPTFLRNATAYGASPNQRFDLVVNDLTALAVLTGRISMQSDGTPWRPFVHILDIAKATACVLGADPSVVRGEVFNVGSNNQNLRVREVAQLVAERVDGCELEFGPPSADARDYRANFDKIHGQLPGFSCDWDVARGIDELVQLFAAIGLDQSMKDHRGHVRLRQIEYLTSTGQIDEDLAWR